MPRPMRLSPILLRPKPSLFAAVREAATKHGLSMPVYVLAVLTQHEGIDPKIFDKTPAEIQKEMRE